MVYRMRTGPVSTGRKLPRWIESSILALLIGTMSGALETPAQAQSADEQHVKAAFLYNFVKFIEWPQAAFTDVNAPIIIGVIGDDRLVATIEQTVSGKTAGGRHFVVRRFISYKALSYCHILFISNWGKDNLRRILPAIVAGVLTVGETEHFAEAGGMINFKIADSKVRFEINQKAAERAGLRISAKLLNLAPIVGQ